MNEQIKYGVVGAGYLGSYHTEQLSKIKAVEILGVFDVIKEKSELLSKKFNIPIFKNLEKLLVACDAISICTPASKHYDIAKIALQNNCHLFIEKPITNDLQSAQKIINTNYNNN